MNTTITKGPIGGRWMMLIAGLALMTTAMAQGRLTVKGAVTVPVGTEGVSRADVTAAGGGYMQIALDRDGRFKVSLPDDDIYTIRFRTDGCVDKLVVVDARNANVGKGKGERTVEFDIALHRSSTLEPARYTAAVGQISFGKEDGKMNVQQHYEMARVSQLLADGTDR